MDCPGCVRKSERRSIKGPRIVFVDLSSLVTQSCRSRLSTELLRTRLAIAIQQHGFLRGSTAVLMSLSNNISRDFGRRCGKTHSIDLAWPQSHTPDLIIDTRACVQKKSGGTYIYIRRALLRATRLNYHVYRRPRRSRTASLIKKVAVFWDSAPNWTTSGQRS